MISTTLVIVIVIAVALIYQHASAKQNPPPPPLPPPLPPSLPPSLPPDDYKSLMFNRGFDVINDGGGLKMVQPGTNTNVWKKEPTGYMNNFKLLYKNGECLVPNSSANGVALGNCSSSNVTWKEKSTDSDYYKYFESVDFPNKCLNNSSNTPEDQTIVLSNCTPNSYDPRQKFNLGT